MTVRPAWRLSCCGFAAMLAAAGLPGAAGAGSPVAAQSTSSFVLAEQDGLKTVAITNVAYAITSSYLEGRPKDERLVLRTTTTSSQVLDEKGMDASVTVEAWTLGADLAAPPAYAIALAGTGATTMDSGVIVIDRGTEDVLWWSLYTLGTGAHLFDTFVPVVRFSITPEMQTLRYAGLDVPPDGADDPRLADPHVIGVLSYASAAGVRRQALLTCDDAGRAVLLRSYWDTARDMAVEVDPSGQGGPALRLSWSPWQESTVAARIPVRDDDLDLAAAELPACVHIAAWQR